MGDTSIVFSSTVKVFFKAFAKEDRKINSKIILDFLPMLDDTRLVSEGRAKMEARKIIEKSP